MTLRQHRGSESGGGYGLWHRAVVLLSGRGGSRLRHRALQRAGARRARWSRRPGAGSTYSSKRRADLIPNLVATVKGYAAHERAALEEVTELPQPAPRACRATMSRPAPPPRASSRRALTRLFAVAEGLSRPQGQRELPGAPEGAVDGGGRDPGMRGAITTVRCATST